MASGLSQSMIVVVPDPELRDLVPVFLSNRRKTLEKLTSLLADKKFPLMAELALDYCEISRPFGFYHLETLGWEVVEAAKVNDENRLSNVLDEIRTYLHEVRIKT